MLAQAKVSHSVMFHHFHNALHPQQQGSLSGSQFEVMLDWLSDTCSLLSADEYQSKAIDNQLENHDICLSLDDALLCQYDVAVPILKRKGLKAFFFVYSSPMKGEPDLLEVFRYFRAVRYSSVEKFYEDFFALSEDLLGGRYSEARQTFVGLDYLKDFPFYSENDRWFRFLRDRVLGAENYVSIMHQLMYAAEFEPKTIASRLWLTDDHLRNLYKDGHVLGLHSYTHPTLMEKLPKERQRLEFEKNLDHLSTVLGSQAQITAMSHPCGSYNEDTLEVLKTLGIEIGFRSSMSRRHINSLLEIPREDHANVARGIGLCV
jgi:peptidoglycan/xylan/chitin deacetylase (PgdA/CDA1 family)